jgi:hypothetical protein
LIWGFAGSRYARFGSFVFGPRALLDYLLGVVRGTGERHIGHNPGSAYAIYAMLVLGIGLSVTGLAMSAWNELEELHEVMAYGMLLAAGAHIAGIVLHTLGHRENIALSMLDGKQEGEPAQSIRSSHALVGVAFLALAAGWSAMVFGGYDARARELTLLGQSIQLGDSEREGSQEHEGERREKSSKDRDHQGDHDD